MKFNVPKDVLLKNVQMVESATGAKTSLPILSNILVEAEENSVYMTGTDLDVGIISTIPLKTDIKGSITIPAKKFLDIIRTLPQTDISISVKKNNMVWVECGKIVFKMIGLPKEEFPQLPEFKDKDFVTIQQKLLRRMLQLVGFSMSQDEVRYVMNGVLFTIKPSYIRLVATDGRRLAMAEREMEFPRAKEASAIVPTKAIQELVGILQEEGDAKVFFGANQVMFDLGQTKIISRLIEGDYPPYEQVIPKEVKDKVGVARDAFLGAVKRVGLYSSQDSIAIKMEFAKDKIVLSKSTPYLGEVKEELEVDYKGKEIVIGFNPEYLADVLKAIDQDQVNFEIVDPEKPGVIRVGKEYVYVVLPMQLA